MTRPMPGPPEDCYCRFGNATCQECETRGYPYSWGLCPGCELHNGRDLGAYKRLKDVECWTEYHHADAAWAKAMVQVLMGYRPMTDELNAGLHRQLHETNTWRRFARTPHALEEA